MANQVDVEIRDGMKLRLSKLRSEALQIDLAYGLYTRAYPVLRARAAKPKNSVEPDGSFHPDFQNYMDRKTFQDRRLAESSFRSEAVKLIKICNSVTKEINDIISLNTLLLNSKPAPTVEVLTIEELAELEHQKAISDRMAKNVVKVVGEFGM